MTERARILVVDDEPANLQLLQRMLRRHYDVVTATSGHEALELLARESFAAILSDQRMPEMTGTELLARARTMVPDTVRMILTGYAPEEQGSVDAINEAHVTTYLTKPVAPDTVERAVADAVELYEMAQRNQRLVEELAEARRQLGRDFEDRLDRELERLVRYGGVLSLAIIDGADPDLLERGAGDRLRLRGTDAAGRLAGRLAILLPGTERRGAYAVCRRLEQSLPDVALTFAIAEAPADGTDRRNILDFLDKQPFH